MNFVGLSKAAFIFVIAIPAYAESFLRLDHLVPVLTLRDRQSDGVDDVRIEQQYEPHLEEWFATTYERWSPTGSWEPESSFEPHYDSSTHEVTVYHYLFSKSGMGKPYSYCSRTLLDPTTGKPTIKYEIESRNRCEIRDADQAIQFSYNPINLSETRLVFTRGSSGSIDWTAPAWITDFEYSPFGKLVRETSRDPSSTSVQESVYTYNSSQQLVSIESRISWDTEFKVVEHQYDALGDRVQTRSYKVSSAGVISDEQIFTMTYDPVLRTRTEDTLDPVWGNLPSRTTFYYDLDGKITYSERTVDQTTMTTRYFY